MIGLQPTAKCPINKVPNHFVKTCVVLHQSPLKQIGLHHGKRLEHIKQIMYGSCNDFNAYGYIKIKRCTVIKQWKGSMSLYPNFKTLSQIMVEKRCVQTKAPVKSRSQEKK